MNRKQPSLIFCILMDLAGYATYAVPLLGELGDLMWAPVSAMIFYKTFGSWKGALGGVFNFIEEFMPGTDLFQVSPLCGSFTKCNRKIPVNK